METSDAEEEKQKTTPNRKLRQFGGTKERQERRKAAVAKYANKELEEIELGWLFKSCFPCDCFRIKTCFTERSIVKKYVNSFTYHN